MPTKSIFEMREVLLRRLLEIPRQVPTPTRRREPGENEQRGESSSVAETLRDEAQPVGWAGCSAVKQGAGFGEVSGGELGKWRRALTAGLRRTFQ
jgi:hypothetical protein